MLFAHNFSKLPRLNKKYERMLLFCVVSTSVSGLNQVSAQLKLKKSLSTTHPVVVLHMLTYGTILTFDIVDYKSFVLISVVSIAVGILLVVGSSVAVVGEYAYIAIFQLSRGNLHQWLIFVFSLTLHQFRWWN